MFLQTIKRLIQKAVYDARRCLGPRDARPGGFWLGANRTRIGVFDVSVEIGSFEPQYESMILDGRQLYISLRHMNITKHRQSLLADLRRYSSSSAVDNNPFTIDRAEVAARQDIGGPWDKANPKSL